MVCVGVTVGNSRVGVTVGNSRTERKCRVVDRSLTTDSCLEPHHVGEYIFCGDQI